MTGNPGPSCQRLAVPVCHSHAVVVSNPINRQKTDVVRRELVFDSGIAETNDQFHRSYQFPVASAVTFSR